VVKGLDSSWVAPSFRRVLLVRLVIEGTIIVIVPIIMSLLLDALKLLALVVNPATCISTVDDVAQVSVIPIMPSVMLLRWSETAGRVPVRILSMVRFMTPYFAVMVQDWVNHANRLLHCL
jgi:hypothetical protein